MPGTMEFKKSGGSWQSRCRGPDHSISSPITEKTAYTFACIDHDGTTHTKQATVRIIPTFQELYPVSRQLGANARRSPFNIGALPRLSGLIFPRANSPAHQIEPHRFSSIASASASLSWWASARRFLTSSEVASRAVSPARRFLPASRNSFDQR